MTAQRIFTRTDGSRVRITSRLYVSSIGGEARFDITVETCAPKKKSWVGVYSMDDYNWRRLDTQGRAEYIREKQLEVCTTGEMLLVKLDVWEKLKPTE